MHKLSFLLAVLIALGCYGCSGGSDDASDATDTGFVAAVASDTTDNSGDADTAPIQETSGDTSTEPEGPYCTPGTTDCVGPTIKGVCNDDGTAFIEQVCAEGLGCLAGECVEKECAPGDPKGECFSTYEYLACNESGTAWEPVGCEGASKCYEGSCEDFFCVPLSTVCYGKTGFKACNAAGTEYTEPELCPDGTQCQQDGPLGICIDACDANVKANIYLGCNYFAVDLDNIEGGEAENVGLVVSVPPDQSEATTITITDMSTGTVLTAAQLGTEAMDIAPGTLRIFLLPTTGPTGANPLDGSVKTFASYQVGSSAPVTVHQFNPLNGESVYTNDASLLLPSNLGGTEYLIMSWPHRNIESNGETIALRGFFTVIATEEGSTTVDIVSRGAIAGGVGVPAIQPFQTYSFLLGQGEVLNLETDGETGEDLTGTWVKASQRVTVLAGHECANIPMSVNYCDHIEQQLYPLETWGSTYVADVFKARNEAQFDLWRVIGGADNVTVTTNPPVPGYESFLLHRGTFVEFQTQESFVLEATGPVLLGHFMIGSNYPGYEVVCAEGANSSGIGDPAMTLGLPTEQLLSSYSVLTPPGYQENYINLVLPAGLDASIDGLPVTGTPVPIGETGYTLLQLEVETGVHTVTAEAPFGLTSYGYDCDVSYAYPGGMQLQTIAHP